MKVIRLILVVFLTFIHCSSYALSPKKIISINSDIYEEFFQDDETYNIKYKIDDLIILEIPEERLNLISKLSHQFYHRCGGYILEENEEGQDK